MRRTLLTLALSLCLAPRLWAQRPTDEYTTQTKTATTTTVKTDAVLWTPAAGKRIVLQQCTVCATGALEGIELEVANVDVIPPFALPSYGCQSFGGSEAPIYTSAKDEVLTYTTPPDQTGRVSVMCSGWEQE